VAPCHLCGADPEELKHLERHQFVEYLLPPGQTTILCNNCWGDVGSFEPEFFGFSQGLPKGLRAPQFQRDLAEPMIGKDKFCPVCNLRLAFLRLVANLRETNRANGAA
jgi:hypothetical protein